MYYGKIIWWQLAKQQGIISVVEADGAIQKYFLLYSKIQRSPAHITVHQFVKFESFTAAPRVGLLPVACACEVSNEPFIDEGLDALKAVV